MLIQSPTRPLGPVDCRALTERVLAADESVWGTDGRRQNDYEVHAQTQSIVLVFFTGWPQVEVFHAAGWPLFADVTMPVIETIVAQYYSPGGMLLRAMFARLPPKCRIDPHVDRHSSFSVAHRIHVPLVTNPQVEFIVGMERVVPLAHHAFELNNMVPHCVTNHGDTARIHLIFDYSPN